ncbi:Predicted metalloprotease [Kluyvera cryocrescens]|uniref:Predicted metalloprotease n=1 Tax=Kluyvera cryocrescens TaxID=580 RepID=A0A485ATR8_KLUCR|nr:Predicted metalloprotease [Kluyvera cryocrescens]
MTGEPIGQQQSSQRVSQPKDDEAAKFTSVILATTEDTWGAAIQRDGENLSASASGDVPWRHPYRMRHRAIRDGAVLLPSRYHGLYRPLLLRRHEKQNLAQGGDFAQGYVIAHEVGHHVQKLLGIEPKVRQMQQNASEAEVNRLSVRIGTPGRLLCWRLGSQYCKKQGILEAGDLGRGPERR